MQRMRAAAIRYTRSGYPSVATVDVSDIAPRSIAALNALPLGEKLRRYGRAIPLPLLRRFNIDPETYSDSRGHALLTLNGGPGSTSVEVILRHTSDAPDPVFYGHLADNLNGQIIVLLVVINNPDSPRFDVDRLPDGTKTQFGTAHRNLPAEEAALRAGLAPGQVRAGLRLLNSFLESFENFVSGLGHSLYFIEPLTYHNAVLFEKYGFAYQLGRRWMESINTRFAPGGDLHEKLNSSSPFRQPEFAGRVRGRSWAIHDGIMGEPYTNVHMYKHIGKHAGINTAPGLDW
jgi:hypothetical protein